MSSKSTLLLTVLLGLSAAPAALSPAWAGVGDPQVRTDHPWYPGELSCSTFPRLQKTQAELYRRVYGTEPQTDEQQALAAWLWRNTHYWHGEEGAENLWGKGFTAGADLRTRDYWKGLFADGMGLCGTTHSQWTVELDALLGHGRSRGVGVTGHNSFEVFLKGGAYGAGRWALLDHDISTVVFSDDGSRLLSIPEVMADWKRLTDRGYLPSKQHGCLVCGLASGDGSVYSSYGVAEYLPGYAGPPPMVHLRRGETFRRYLQPGLEDGKTFVFWGRSYNTAGIPGPERSQTWVNQPEKMHGSIQGAGYHPGQARYANAVYTYRPDFAGGSYREGVTDEAADHVTFEFYSPYIIGATPPNTTEWGIYDAGGRNGLVLHGTATCGVSVSVDQGKTWTDCGAFRDGLDLTDHVKGHRQYLLRFGVRAKALAASGLTMRTVCQVNSSTIPRLKDGGSAVTFEASNRAVVSAGPTIRQAEAHVVEGAFGTPRVTLEIASPRGEKAVGIAAVGHVMSGNPPSPEVKYQIEYSTDGGQSWKRVVQDWTIVRQGDEPRDFWSQSLCYGSVDLPGASSKVRVRFRNDGGKSYARCEAHLIYRTPPQPTQVTFDWKDDSGAHRASHTFEASAGTWSVPTGKSVETRWVEYTPASGGGNLR